MQNGKTVYVLGAGFSAAAKFPLQSQLLSQLKGGVFDLAESESPLTDPTLDPVEDPHQSRIMDFCECVFPSNEEDQPLEDVFTLLDQIIFARGHFAKYDTAELTDIRSSFIYALLRFLHSHSERYLSGSETLYRRFAVHLLKSRLDAGQQCDPVSVISLNWDSLLEDAVYAVLADVDAIGKADIDYCVYTVPLPGSPHYPSTKQKASGRCNLKLLKLHGSSTWLRCPNSNHIYTGLGHPEGAQKTYLEERSSPFICDGFPDDREADKPPMLEPYLITPSYSKVFDQPQIQTTWHNAYVELREASRIVFIGYSLPEADYHFRTLLRRAIRTSAEIEIVLWETDRPPPEDSPTGDVNRPGALSPGPVGHYRKLFGRSRVDRNCRFDGVAAYIDDLLGEQDYSDALAELHAMFRRMEVRDR